MHVYFIHFYKDISIKRIGTIDTMIPDGNT